MIRMIYETDTIEIAEQAPTQRSISVWQYVDGENRLSRHFLSWPYVLFVWHKRWNGVENSARLHAYASDRPVRKSTDVVGRLPLPNTYPNGRMCLGLDPASVMDGIQAFFNVPFNVGEVTDDQWKTSEAQAWRDGRKLTTQHCPSFYPLDNVASFKSSIPLHLDHKDREISDRAYYLWEAAGRPFEPSPRFWGQAEIDILYGKYK